MATGKTERHETRYYTRGLVDNFDITYKPYTLKSQQYELSRGFLNTSVFHMSRRDLEFLHELIGEVLEDTGNKEQQ